MLYKCERCNNIEGVYDNIKFTWGVHARLCNQCINEHNRIILNSNLNKLLELVVAKERYYEALALAGKPVYLYDYENLQKEKNEITIQLEKFTTNFIKENNSNI